MNYTYVIYIICNITYISCTVATYHVQNLTVSIASNGSVMVQCIFIDISTADGCHVTFTDSSQGIIESFNITKPNSTESVIEEYITLSFSGNYTVIVYDIVDCTIIDTPSVIYHNVISLQLYGSVLAPSSVITDNFTIVSDTETNTMAITTTLVFPSKLYSITIINLL